MLFPRVFGEDLFPEFPDWSEWMNATAFPGQKAWNNTEKKLYGKNAAHVMKTDIHDMDGQYEIITDLPGFKKDQIGISLEDGYLTICASKGLDTEQNDQNGKIIRQERYAGTMQRSFFVGEAVTEADIHAKFEDGVLHITVPKKDAKKLPERRYIAIEG